MRSTLVAAAMLVAAGLASLALGSLTLRAEDKLKELTVKDVMKQALAGETSLCKKVATGEGTKEDAQKLLELVTVLTQHKPPKGDEKSWKEKTTALVAAATARPPLGGRQASPRAVLRAVESLPLAPAQAATGACAAPGAPS